MGGWGVIPASALALTTKRPVSGSLTPRKFLARPTHASSANLAVSLMRERVAQVWRAVDRRTLFLQSSESRPADACNRRPAVRAFVAEARPNRLILIRVHPGDFSD